MTPSSVGVFVLIFSEDKTGVLLVQHSYNNNQWSLPGGALEPEETVIDAGKRETEEETGLIPDISNRTLVGIFSRRIVIANGIAIADVVFLFVGSIGGGKLNGSTDETIGAKFIPFCDLGNYEIYPTQRKLIEHVRAWKPGDQVIIDFP